MIHRLQVVLADQVNVDANDDEVSVPLYLAQQQQYSKSTPDLE